MILLARGAAIAIVAVASIGANAADLNYPPPAIGYPQQGMAPPPQVAPPQIIIVPGPIASPQYNRPPVAPPPYAPPPYGIAPPPVPRADVAPRAACPPIWRCDARGCGWQSSCVPPERYSGRYDSPGLAYPRPGAPGPQVYYPPDTEPVPEQYPGPYSPQQYPDPTWPYSR